MKQIARCVDFLHLFVVFCAAPDETLIGLSGVHLILYKHIRVSATNWQKNIKGDQANLSVLFIQWFLNKYDLNIVRPMVWIGV